MDLVYLSVENRYRELDSRLLIAGALAEKGITSVVGQQWLLNTNCQHLPKGVFVFKGMNTIQARNMGNAAACGHLPAAIDEEGVVLCQKDRIQRDISQGCPVKRVYVHSTLHKTAVEDALEGVPVIVTGNPRIDLLDPAGYREEADRLGAEHGEFVLVNTNTAVLNSIHGGPESVKELFIRVGWFRPGEGPEDFADILEHNAVSARRIREFIDGYPGKVVLRPHPAEDASTWERLYANTDRVQVIREGSHIPWILASKALVHVCCTTGLEAAYLGHPVISLRTGERIDNFYVSSQINPATVDQALQMVSGEIPVSAIEHDGMAHQRIADDLAELVKPGGDIGRLPKPVDRTDYQREKMTVTQGEIEQFYAARGKSIRVKEIGDSVFRIGGL